MKSSRFISSNTDLVSRDNIPENDPVAGANGLEPGVANGPTNAPVLGDVLEMVEVGGEWDGSGSVDGCPPAEICEGRRHGWCLDTASCQGA